MNYGKAIAMLVATVLSGIVAAMTGDEHVDRFEWVSIGLVLLAAASVFTAPNVPGARYTKVILAVLVAVVGALGNTVLVTPGVTATEVMQLILAGLGAAGVYAAKYTPPSAIRAYQPRPTAAG